MKGVCRKSQRDSRREGGRQDSTQHKGKGEERFKEEGGSNHARRGIKKCVWGKRGGSRN